MTNRIKRNTLKNVHEANDAAVRILIKSLDGKSAHESILDDKGRTIVKKGSKLTAQVLKKLQLEKVEMPSRTNSPSNNRAATWLLPCLALTTLLATTAPSPSNTSAFTVNAPMSIPTEYIASSWQAIEKPAFSLSEQADRSFEISWDT